MSQVSQITLDNVSFATFRSNLNSTLNALNTSHVGSSAPSTVAQERYGLIMARGSS